MWIAITVLATAAAMVLGIWLLSKVILRTVAATAEILVATIRPSRTIEQPTGTTQAMFEEEEAATSLPWEEAEEAMLNSPTLPEPYNPMDDPNE